MKILTNVNTVFSDKLVELVKKHLEGKVNSGAIGWSDIYNIKLDEIVPKLANGLALTLQDRTQRIDTVAILEDLTIAKIFLSILRLESRNIDRILGTHELLRKDDVQTITDIKRRYLDIVNHSVQEFKTNGVEILDGIIRLFPSLSQGFTVRDIQTSYLPESYVAKVGNNPAPDNVSQGTDSGYWLATLYLRGQEPASSIMIMDFGDSVAFNRLKINSAGRFPLTLTNVEVLDNNGNFQSIHIGDVTSKYISVVYPTSYETSQVRITVQQQLGEYVWWTNVTNERDLVMDSTREDALRVSTLESRKEMNFVPVVSTRLDNVFSYTMGAYNIVLYLDIYPGDTDGTFYSQKFTADSPIQTIQLSRDIIEYKPGVSTITYNIIQQDGSRVPIVPGQKLVLDKTFIKTETLNNGQDNWVQLSSSPLPGTEVLVNGELATPVSQLTGSGGLEYIVSGNKLFFSVLIGGKTVTARYSHNTDYFIVEILLNNNVKQNCFDTPSLENFSVVINGID